MNDRVCLLLSTRPALEPRPQVRPGVVREARAAAGLCPVRRARARGGRGRGLYGASTG